MKFLINSHVNNKKAVDLLFQSLRRCEEFDRYQFIVCMGGHEPIDTYEHTTKDNVTTILCGHNSIDFTALVTAIDYDAPDLFCEDDHYFYMHDTCIVGDRFLKIIHSRTDHDLIGMKLLSSGSHSKNMGLYSHKLLTANSKFLYKRAKNTDYTNLEHYKTQGFRWEDQLFKHGKNGVVIDDYYSDSPSHVKHLNHGYFVYIGDVYNNSTTRAVLYFNDLDLYKLHSNTNHKAVRHSFSGETYSQKCVIINTDNGHSCDPGILDTIYKCGNEAIVFDRIHSCNDPIPNKKLLLLLRGHIKHTLDESHVKDMIESLSLKYDLHVYICTWDHEYQDEFWSSVNQHKDITDIYSEDIENSKRNNNLVTRESIQKKLGDCMQYVRDIQILNQYQVDQQLVGNTDGCILASTCKTKGWKRMWHQINHGMEMVSNSQLDDTMIINTRFDLIETSKKLNILTSKCGHKRRRRLAYPVVNPVGFTDAVMNSDLRVNDSIYMTKERLGADNFYMSSVAVMKTISYWFSHRLDHILKLCPEKIKSQELILKHYFKHILRLNHNEIDQQTI